MIYVLAVSFQDVRNWCQDSGADLMKTTAVLTPQALEGVKLAPWDRVVHAPHFHRNPLYRDMVEVERRLRGATT